MKNILIAEDEDGVRNLQQMWLERHGDWDVRGAVDGEDALEKLDGNIDLLILDLIMPNLGGDEVYERLPETDFTGEVIVCTASPESRRMEICESDIYLTKPVMEEKFIKAVQEVTAE
jgi:CheY-like chemotaxis protein